MLDGRHALVLEFLHRADDLVAEFNRADTLIALLDAGRLALDVDLEPDAADAGGLHEQVTRFARDARVRLVAADDGVQGTVAADLLVDDDVDHDIALRRQPELLQVLNREHVAGDAALHVARAPAVDASVLDLGRP